MATATRPAPRPSSTGRFVITFWSSYQIVAFGLNQAQLISLAGLIVGLLLLAIVLRRHRPVQAIAQS